MALPPKLVRELEILKKSHIVEVTEDQACANVIFKKFPLGEGFSQATADLLIRIPLSYPDSGPDMFWTEPTVMLADTKVPQSAESFEEHCNRRWRRFSWHRKQWNPVTDDVESHLEFVRKRLAQKR